MASSVNVVIMAWKSRVFTPPALCPGPDRAVEGAPTFEDVKVDRTGSQGQDVVITCVVHGTPAPDIQLWREGAGTDVTSFQGIQVGVTSRHPGFSW